jgi:hypothetical protein
MRYVRLLSIAALSCLAAAAQESLPKAEALIEKFIQVTGGKAAYEKLKTETSSGTMEFTGKGIKGSMNTFRAAPDKMYVLLDIEGIGKMEEGVDGQIAWSKNAMQGPRIKDGEEKILSVRGARFNAELSWRELYKKAETQGVETVNGQKCYKVLMTPTEGPPMTRYYDAGTGYLVKINVAMKTAMGEFTVDTEVSDYRKEGELTVPHKVTQKVAGQEFTITIDSVKYNVEIPKDKFDLPEDVKALLAK